MKTSKCKKHGIITDKEAYRHKDPRYKEGYKLRCLKCYHANKIRNFRGNTSTHCKIHGDLNEENAYKCVENGKVRFRCRPCSSVVRKAQYANNRDQAILDAAKWKRENRKRVNELAAQDRINNPEKYEKWRKDYYERNAKTINKRSICRYHGLEIKTYEQMFENQNNQCAICGKEETRKSKGKLMRLCIDHNHETGKIRALLCHDCNSGLGKFYDSPDLLTKAAIYLMDHQ